MNTVSLAFSLHYCSLYCRKSSPNEFIYNVSKYKHIENATREEEIGPQIVHIYNIHNDGPSTFEEAEIYVLWPYETNDFEPLMYLLQQPETNGNIECSPTSYVNQRDLELDSYAKSRSELEKSGVTVTRGSHFMAFDGSRISSGKTTSVSSSGSGSSSSSSSSIVTSSSSSSASSGSSSSGRASGSSASTILTEEQKRRLDAEQSLESTGDGSLYRGTQISGSSLGSRGSSSGGSGTISGGTGQGTSYSYYQNSTTQNGRPGVTYTSSMNRSSVMGADGRVRVTETSTEQYGLLLAGQSAGYQGNVRGGSSSNQQQYGSAASTSQQQYGSAASINQQQFGAAASSNQQYGSAGSANQQYGSAATNNQQQYGSAGSANQQYGSAASNNQQQYGSAGSANQQYGSAATSNQQQYGSAARDSQRQYGSAASINQQQSGTTARVAGSAGSDINRDSMALNRSSVNYGSNSYTRGGATRYQQTGSFGNNAGLFKNDDFSTNDNVNQDISHLSARTHGQIASQNANSQSSSSQSSSAAASAGGAASGRRRMMSQQDGEEPRPDFGLEVSGIERIAQGGSGFQTTSFDLGKLDRDGANVENRQQGSAQVSQTQNTNTGYQQESRRGGSAASLGAGQQSRTQTTYDETVGGSNQGSRGSSSYHYSSSGSGNMAANAGMYGSQGSSSSSNSRRQGQSGGGNEYSFSSSGSSSHHDGNSGHSVHTGNPDDDYSYADLENIEDENSNHRIDEIRASQDYINRQASQDNVNRGFKHYPRLRRDANTAEEEEILSKALQCTATRCAYLKCVVGPLAKGEDAWIALRTRMVAFTLHKVIIN